MPPSRTLAPWAEIVPGVGPTTVDALLVMPDDGWRYEVVEGVLVRVAGSGKQATTIGGNIYFALRSFVQPRRLGVPTPADGVYKFAGAETGLLPDAGFYAAARDALITDPTKPIPFAPDFAIEVASPSQGGPEMTEKARVYISNGTSEVWVFWPGSKQVDIWRSRDTRDVGDYVTHHSQPLRHTDIEEYKYNPFVNRHPSGDMYGVLGVGNGPGIYTIRSSVVEGFTVSLDDLFPPRNYFVP